MPSTPTQVAAAKGVDVFVGVNQAEQLPTRQRRRLVHLQRVCYAVGKQGAVDVRKNSLRHRQHRSTSA